LALNSATGISLWIDGVRAEVNENLVTDVKAGAHTLILGIDLSKRHSGVRCEVHDSNDSAARVRITGGK
jgi:hypothetical protein